MFSIKICCFKRQAQKQLPQHHLMCRDDVKQESHWMPGGKLNCLLLVCLAKQISQLRFQKYFLHIYSKNDSEIYLVLSLSGKKCFQGGTVFTKLEEDLLEFIFVIFKAFGVEYNNQARFCFIQLQRHFC